MKIPHDELLIRQINIAGRLKASCECGTRDSN